MSAPPGSSLQAELELALARRADGQVGFDTVTRVLYSTDASNHQVEPLGVVLPRHDEALQAAIEAHWPRACRRASGCGLNYLTGFAPSTPPSWDGTDRPCFHGRTG